MPEGLKAALAGAHTPPDPGSADRSPTLPGLPDLPGSGAAGAQGELAGIAEDAETPAPPAGPGRPKGARNKSTREWTEYLTRRYGSPLERAVRLAMSNTEDVMAEMVGAARLQELKDRAAAQSGEARAELAELRRAALARQDRAGEAALPYIHQKQPTAIEIPDLPSVAFGVVLSGQVISGDRNLLEIEAEDVDDVTFDEQEDQFEDDQ